MAAGDEVSLRRALELEPDHPAACAALARILVDRGEPDEALTLLARIPETAEHAADRGRGPPGGQDVEVPADGVDVAPRRAARRA